MSRTLYAQKVDKCFLRTLKRPLHCNYNNLRTVKQNKDKRLSSSLFAKMWDNAKCEHSIKIKHFIRGFQTIYTCTQMALGTVAWWICFSCCFIREIFWSWTFMFWRYEHDHEIYSIPTQNFALHLKEICRYVDGCANAALQGVTRRKHYFYLLLLLFSVTFTVTVATSVVITGLSYGFCHRLLPL